MIRLFPAAVLLCAICFSSYGQFNGYVPGDYYLEIGGGIAPFQNSRISNTELTRPSLYFYGEFGKFRNPFSLTAGYDFLTTYELGSFELKPTYAFLHVKINLKRLQFHENQLTFFGFLGPAIERTQLSVKSTNQVLVDDSETKMGVAFTSGLGVQYELRMFTVAVRGTIYRSNRNFLAGGFEESAYKTGSERILFTVGFKIKQCESSSKKCSTYN